MIDHISIVVSDYSKASNFYRRALAPLGMSCLFEVPGALRSAGFGQAPRPVFWIAERTSPLNPVHVALSATSIESVEAFFRAALAAGGTDNGGPGYRQYHPGYYAAFVLDPDGHNIEAVYHDPSRSQAM